MKKHARNRVNNAADTIQKRIKKTQKIISILVVFLLISTIASSIASSSPFKNNDLRDRVEAFQENVENVVDKLTNAKTVVENEDKDAQKPSFVSFIKGFLALKNSDSAIALYTKYEGNETRTDLKLLRANKVDVNDDGVDDISVRLSLFPFIEKPLSLSINFKLSVKRLAGFPDKNAEFETYAEIVFPGILSGQLKDDILHFGYQSKDGEDIPDSCAVTYKFIPHLMSLSKKPEHKLSVDPGDIAGSQDISLLLSYYAAENDTVSDEHIWEIEYNPAIKTEVSFGRSRDSGVVTFGLSKETSDSSVVTLFYTRNVNGSSSSVGFIIDPLSSMSFNVELTPLKKGGGSIEFERLSGESTNIALFVKQNASVYVYVDDLPSHVLFSWDLSRSGHVYDKSSI